MLIVLLPGLDGTGELFKPLLKYLPDEINAEVISYPANKKLNYKQLENYVRDRLPDNEEYILVAESFSGVIAYNLAKNNPGNLRTVVFVASFLKAPLPYLALFQILPLSILFKLPVPGFILRNYLFGDKISKQTIHLFREAMSKVSGKVLAYRFRQVANLDCNLEKINVPCIYIQALEDKLVPASNINIFRKIAPKVKTIPLHGPHFILQAKPTECAKIIAEKYHLKEL